MNKNKNKSHQVAVVMSADRQQQQLLEPNSKIILGQHEEALIMSNEEKQKTPNTCCLGKKCILLLSMTSALIIAAILVAILTISLIQNEHHSSGELPFQQPSYKLFSTKTAYHNALSYLNSSAYTPQLPSIFAKQLSLKQLDDQLRLVDQCKIRQLHFFGRHANRYPNLDNSKDIIAKIGAIQERIDLSKLSTATSQAGATADSTVASTSGAQLSAASNNLSYTSIQLSFYKQWRPFVEPELSNQLMNSGFEDSTAIAQRFKSIYPNLFDGSQSKIEIGVTGEARTAQTALSFMRLFDNFSFDSCGLSSAASKSTDESASNAVRSQPAYLTDQKWQTKECHSKIKESYRKEKLDLHKKCQSYHKEILLINNNFNLNDPNRTAPIAVSVSKKLKLSKEAELSVDETKAIYNTCKYETALRGWSIWCALFTDNELKFYEYLDDIEDFFNQAYGHPNQMKSACPITTELMRALRRARSSSYFAPGSRSQTQPALSEAYFYFTHSAVLQRLIAASMNLEGDTDYSTQEVLKHLEAGTAPKSRTWRTSLFTPFSANLAFSLYECPKRQKQAFGQPASEPSEGDSDEYTESDASQGVFKVVASLNERPIRLDGCLDHVCDMRKLEYYSRLNEEKRCKLEDICKKEIVVK